MALVPLKQVEQQLQMALKRRQVGQWTVRTFKQDRELSLLITDQQVQLQEAGYQQHTWVLTPQENGRKLLKTIFRREFPRSHQVYLHVKD